MNEWGLFSDESADWTAEQAVEAGFWSEQEARAALASRYSPEDELTVHPVEEDDDDETELEEEERLERRRLEERAEEGWDEVVVDPPGPLPRGGCPSCGRVLPLLDRTGMCAECSELAWRIYPDTRP